MKTPEDIKMKPCPFCGSDKIDRFFNTVQVKIRCSVCGAKIARSNNGKQYATIANCRKRVEPLAIEAWNRRTTDENA